MTDATANGAPLYIMHLDRSYWFEPLRDDGILYCQYNHVRNDPAESLAEFAARLCKAFDSPEMKALVIDLRWNNGGDTFVNEAFLKALLRDQKLAKPGALYVIVGRRTFSAAMNCASYLKRFFHPVFVGEPTGGTPNIAGHEVPAMLPYSRLMFNVSDLYWQSYWPEDHSIWIAPDIYVAPKFADIAAMRDPAVEAIRQTIKTPGAAAKPN
jgi:C-terminal processing protease CtpA/Prc